MWHALLQQQIIVQYLPVPRILKSQHHKHIIFSMRRTLPSFQLPPL